MAVDLNHPMFFNLSLTFIYPFIIQYQKRFLTFVFGLVYADLKYFENQKRSYSPRFCIGQYESLDWNALYLWKVLKLTNNLLQHAAYIVARAGNTSRRNAQVVMRMKRRLGAKSGLVSRIMVSTHVPNALKMWPNVKYIPISSERYSHSCLSLTARLASNTSVSMEKKLSPRKWRDANVRLWKGHKGKHHKNLC